MRYEDLSAGNKLYIVQLKSAKSKNRKKWRRHDTQHNSDPATSKPRASSVVVWSFDSHKDYNQGRYRFMSRSEGATTSWHWATHVAGNSFKYEEMSGIP
jgi:hypothetical protein